MTAFPPIDMAEVTRLTREGRLTEAMALLQGQAGGPAEGRAEGRAEDRTQEQAGAPRGAGGPDGVIDMVAPARSGEAWTAPPPAGPRSEGRDPPGARKPSGAPDARAAWGARLDPGAMARGLAGRLGDLAKARPASAGPSAEPVPPGARFEARRFTGEAGTLGYKLYVPSSHAGQAWPLVVMLHGCTQSPDDFAAGTGMNALAEAEGFLVAYPEQTRAGNASRCWNWFEAGHQRRGGGEPALVAGLTQAVVGELGLDPARVYVAGLSAGGAAAAVLGAAYPDLFAAVGVHSGLACGAARDMPSAFAAMKGEALPAKPHARPMPTIVFHGDADRTVHPRNGDHVLAQAVPAAGSPGGATESTTVQGRSEGGVAYTRTVRRDARGRAVLEHWVLHGAGHAWAGGSARGTYTDPNGPDASRAMLAFFRQHVRGEA